MYKIIKLERFRPDDYDRVASDCWSDCGGGYQRRRITNEAKDILWHFTTLPKIPRNSMIFVAIRDRDGVQWRVGYTWALYNEGVWHSGTCVHNGHRQRGVGTKLFRRKLVEWEKDHKHTRLPVYIDKDNVWSLNMVMNASTGPVSQSAEIFWVIKDGLQVPKHPKNIGLEDD